MNRFYIQERKHLNRSKTGKLLNLLLSSDDDITPCAVHVVFAGLTSTPNSVVTAMLIGQFNYIFLHYPQAAIYGGGQTK